MRPSNLIGAAVPPPLPCGKRADDTQESRFVRLPLPGTNIPCIPMSRCYIYILRVRVRHQRSVPFLLLAALPVLNIGISSHFALVRRDAFQVDLRRHSHLSSRLSGRSPQQRAESDSRSGME